MSKINKFLLLALVIVVIFLVFNAIKKTEQFSKVKPTNRISQSENNLNSVTVTVKPKILKIGEKPTFEIEFSTHSVDLSFDVVQQSYLVDGKGKLFKEAVWEGSPPGGHHRSGTLSFNNSLAQTNNVELIIKNIAGVAERKFKWNL